MEVPEEALDGTDGRHRTPDEEAAGAPPFSGWSVNVRCLEGVDVDAIPVQRVHGSRLP
jgi:hypothetical protein